MTLKEKVMPFLRPCLWFFAYIIVEFITLRVNVILGAIIAGFVLYYVIKHPRTKPRKLKYKGWVIDLGLLIAMFILSILYSTLMHVTSTSTNQTEVAQLFKSNPLMIIFIAFIAPVMEETVFRYSIINFRSKKWLIISALISIIVFTCCHLSNSMSQMKYFIQYFIPASGLTASYIITKDIRYSIGLHITYNLIAALIMLAA